MRTTLCSSLTRCITSKWFVLFTLVLLAVAFLPTPASAQVAQGTCLQDEFNVFNGDTSTTCAASPSSVALGCSAGDVSVSTVAPSSVHNITNPNLGASCFQNLPFDFVAEFEIVTTSRSSRSNVGLYFATLPPCSATVTTNCNPPEPAHSSPGGTSGALCGKCSDNIISPRTATVGGTSPHLCPGTNFVCGSDNYHELDGSPTTDNCGDTSSSDVSTDFGNAKGAEGVVVEVTGMFCGGPTAPCVSDPTKQCLVMNYCTSWQIPGGVQTCSSTPGTWPYVDAATPPNGSKCNCSTVLLPITPISVTATAKKAFTTSITTGPADFTGNVPTPNNCDAGIEGQAAATYYVNIGATASGGSSVIVDQICDTAYGTIYDDGLMNTATPPARVFPTCPAGSIGGTLSSNSCSSGLTFTPPATGQCNFTAPAIGELKTVSDQVTASGHSSITQTSTFTTAQSNQVMVHSQDAPTSATATKSYVSTIAACATARLSVVVANTSAFDEQETLSALSDTIYGDLTSCKGTTNGCTSTGNGNILGTTCGVTAGSPGLGTLSGVNATSTSCVASGGTPPTFTSCNGGALPATLPGGTGTVANPTSTNGGVYQCEFDVQFCGGLDANGCISAQPDSVNATLKGDETADTAFTQSANTLHVTSCIGTTAN